MVALFCGHFFFVSVCIIIDVTHMTLEIPGPPIFLRVTLKIQEWSGDEGSVDMHVQIDVCTRRGQ